MPHHRLPSSVLIKTQLRKRNPAQKHAFRRNCFYEAQEHEKLIYDIKNEKLGEGELLIGKGHGGIFILHVHGCFVFIQGYAPHVCSTHGGQKRAVGPSVLELQMVVEKTRIGTRHPKIKLSAQMRCICQRGAEGRNKRQR